MQFKSVLTSSAFMALAGAQSIVTTSGGSSISASVAVSTTVSQVMPPAATQGFNSNNVTSSEKFSWCLAQTNTCPDICGGFTSDNRCDSVTLTYSCVCQNGTVPDCTAFQQTLPFFICQATYGQCVNNNMNNAEGQATCRSNQQCGSRNATAEEVAASSASSAATASSSGSQSSSASGSATSSAASATASGSEASITTYTTGAFVAILMAAFKLLL